MGIWAAYIVPRGGSASAEAPVHAATAEDCLRRLLPGSARFHTGNGFGVAAADGAGGEPARLNVSPDGARASVVIGDPEEAGCSLSVEACPDGGSAAARAASDPFGLFSVFRARLPDGGTWYASDPRLLASLPGKGNTDIDPAALHGYLCFSHVPMPLTMFRGVKRVEAAVFPPPPPITREAEGEAEAEAKASVVPFPAPPLSGAEGERLLAHLRAAVRNRLGKDSGSEIGVYLSGGLDSSLVAALLKEAGARVRLFTLDFGPPHDIELPFARLVAEHLNLPLHVVRARPRDIRAALDAAARALPQPFGDAVTVPLYLLGKAAKEYVGEIWNGEGGDQLFGGWANKPMVAAALYGSGSGNDGDAEMREYLATYHRFYGTTERLYSPMMRERTADIDPADWIRPALCTRTLYPTLIHRLRAANLRLKGAQNIAPRCVALAQCHGLRVRAPFFDRVLTQWTFTLSPSMFLSGACEKYLLKQVAQEYLPEEIVWREKRGMGAPAAHWCLPGGFLRPAGPVRRAALHRLSARRVRRTGWFDPAFVSRLLRGEDPTPEAAFRNRRIGEKIWTLLMLEAWREAHSKT